MGTSCWACGNGSGSLTPAARSTECPQTPNIASTIPQTPPCPDPHHHEPNERRSECETGKSCDAGKIARVGNEAEEECPHDQIDDDEPALTLFGLWRSGRCTCTDVPATVAALRSSGPENPRTMWTNRDGHGFIVACRNSRTQDRRARAVESGTWSFRECSPGDSAILEFFRIPIAGAFSKAIKKDARRLTLVGLA